MFTALMIPLVIIALTAVAVYRIFAFLRSGHPHQQAQANWQGETPTTPVSSETLRPRI